MRSAALAALVALAPASIAIAQSSPPEPREIPDYGGVPEHEAPEEALLWIPRVIFYPVHLLLEYGVRYPLRELFRLIEVEHIDVMFVRGIASDDDDGGNWWFVPLFRFDQGFQPTAGLMFRAHDDARVLSAQLGIDLWGIDQIRGRARGSVRAGSTLVSLSAVGSYRTDRIFHGLGWNSPSEVRGRYGHAVGRARLTVVDRFWQRSSLAGGVRLEGARFEDSSFSQGDDLTMREAIARAGPAPGFPDGFTALSPFVRLVVDSRDERGWPHATGVRAEAFGSFAVDVERGPSESWARAGGALELAIELMPDRTLRARGLLEIAEPLGESEIPFTEQIVLGGAMERMPGFLEGRLIDRSAAVIGIGWRYEVWTWLDAELFVDAGNVFGARLSDFHVERARLSFGAALRARGGDDFTLLVAFGTDPFVEGADISSIRGALSIGAAP